MDKIFRRKKVFIGYITGGDGGIDYTVACAKALIEGGVDILEIGLPFSDPVADGPVIQRAHERALKHGTTADTLLEIGRRLQGTVHLVLFSYYNPLLQKGEKYFQELKAAGFEGVIIVDLPFPENIPELVPILLASPSTHEKRLAEINKRGRGFVYYVSQKGTTGVRKKLADDFPEQIARIRSHTSLPIAAGFGIADRESAQHALESADGFVVGSAFVKLMEEKASPEELKKLAERIDPRGTV